MNGITYKEAGVDIEKGDALVEKIKTKVKSTYGDRVESGVGGFACLYKITEDKLLAAGTDGVGTKLLLAHKLGIHHTVGIDLVAMCVNDILCTGARPLFFMDYLACGKLDLGISEAVIEGVVEGCRQSGCALIGGETAEMPGMYPDGEYDLAGFAVGEVQRCEVLDGTQVKDGDTLIGVAASGFHSNGFSLLRKLISEDEKSLMEAVLTPTRIYVKLITPLIEQKLVSGIAHITGGGFLNIARMNGNYDYVIDDMKFAEHRPEFMDTVVARSGLDISDLYRTFNMGLGLVMATAKPEAVIKELHARQERAFVLGNVVKGSGKIILKQNECVIL